MSVCRKNEDTWQRLKSIFLLASAPVSLLRYIYILDACVEMLLHEDTEPIRLPNYLARASLTPPRAGLWAHTCIISLHWCRL